MAQITKRLVADAIREKANPSSPYAKLPDYMSYSYEGPGGIYFWARRYFPEYNKLYKTNEEFLKYFSRDLNNNAPGLLKSINDETKLAEEHTPVAEVGQETARQPVIAGVIAGEAPVTMTKGGHGPNIVTPNIPLSLQQNPDISAFTKGFENEPEFKTNPDIAPPQETPNQPTQPTSNSRSQSFQIPKIPSGISNAAQNVTSSVGLPIGKFIRSNLTATRIATGISAVIGGIVGGGLGGNMGMFAGAVGGAILPSAIKSGAITPMLSGAGNGGLNAFERFSKITGPKFGGIGISKLKGFGTGKKVALAFTLFSVFFGVSLIAGIINPGTTPSSEASPPILGDISSCTFYRGGDNVQGLKIANPALVYLINEISTKVGVPSTIVAGIMRVETTSAITSTSDYLSNDYDAHSSGVAYGTMQFTPATFESTFSSNSAEMLSLFGKTEARTTIDGQNTMAPSNVLRIYSIRDSLIAAAFKIKVDKKSINADGPWDENTIKGIAKRYYGTNADGTTNYPGADGSTQNYGADLWKSFSSCQTSPSTIGVLASCPIENPIISCGSLNSGHPNCEHANTNKGYPYRSSYSESTQKGIDVVGSNPLNSDQHLVYLPSINNQPTRWEYVGEEPIPDFNVCQPPANCSGHEWGFNRMFVTNVGNDTWSVHLKHLNSGEPILSKGTVYSSGTSVGKLYPNLDGPGRAHNHINILKNNQYLRADVDLKMCNPTY